MLETLLPQIALKPELGRQARDYFEPFPPLHDVWLEIGFGGGEHLIWQAQTHPDVGIIGVEPYVAGMAKMLSKLAPPSVSLEFYSGEAAEKGALRNIRLYTDDARDVIHALPDASLGRVFLLFPDPWPKARHHKRRFIQSEMLTALARVMKKAAELRFATDDAGYLVWALEHLSAHPQFHWLAQSSGDWRERPADWPETRYEAKAKRAARLCTYLRFARA